MKKSMKSFVVMFVLAIAQHADAQDQPAIDAIQKKLDGKVAKLIEAAKIDDAAKVEKITPILSSWLTAMTTWHEQNDAQLKTLWSEWAEARKVVPKDEYPGEVIAHKIDEVYATLKPAYQEMIAKLSTEITPEQVDAMKEYWSRSPGMTRTYNAYVELAGDLNDVQKKVIHDQMAAAREASMLTDADKEIVNIYKVHKVKAEAYIGTIEFAKLHKAFANKGKEPNPTTKPSGSDNR